MAKDRLTIWNERVKLFAGFLNTIGIGMIGFSVLRPVIEEKAIPESLGWVWAAAGIVMHLCAHYVMGRMRKVP
ncbi:hypothetical protein ACRARG_16765 [Pseudooceanicola sp. C21-150M6]|uniref:hypothetical protein n=1 Tax=Pseudooceanicola sp. C21-150M6 TaxID=3434355 RepID=UPI003D7F9B26